MSFFSKSKKSEIPPVEARNDLLSNGGRNAGPPAGYGYNQQSQGPQRSNSNASAASGRPPTYQSQSNYQSSYSSWDPRASQGQGSQPAHSQGGYRQGPSQQQYGQARQGGYRGDDGDNNRRELFKDARPPKASYGAQDLDQPYSSYGRQSSGYGQEGQQEQEGVEDNEDEEVEAIKQQMRFTKQESLASTRNALRAAREAEETGRNTLVKLGDQSERLANTERALDMTKAHNDRAADEAREIKSLNKSIFRPSFTWNKSAKRDAAERKILDRHHEEREEREETRRQVFESRERIGNTFRQAEQDRNSSSNRYGSQAANNAVSKLSGKSRYQFEADEEDDQVEDELNSNLDEIGQLSKSLNLLARAAGEEVRTQNSKLDTLNNKTDRVDTKIVANGIYLNRIK